MIFRHFQRCVSKYVFKEPVLSNTIDSLQQTNVLPILNMVTNIKTKERINNYHDRILKEYHMSFHQYSNKFHVVTPTVLGDNAGKIVINTNKILNSAILHYRCKIILNTLTNTTYDYSDIFDQYTYLYNTEHKCNVYKIYDIQKDIVKMKEDIRIHNDLNIYLGIVVICECYEKYIVKKMLSKFDSTLKTHIIYVDKKHEYLMTHSEYGDMMELMFKPSTSSIMHSKFVHHMY